MARNPLRPPRLRGCRDRHFTQRHRPRPPQRPERQRPVDFRVADRKLPQYRHGQDEHVRVPVWEVHATRSDMIR